MSQAEVPLERIYVFCGKWVRSTANGANVVSQENTLIYIILNI